MRHIRLHTQDLIGDWVPDCEYFRALASVIVAEVGGWVETGCMPSITPYLDSLVHSPPDLGPAVPGATVTREWYVRGVGLVRADFEGRKQARRGFPAYWVRGETFLLHPCPEGEQPEVTTYPGPGAWLNG